MTPTAIAALCMFVFAIGLFGGYAIAHPDIIIKKKKQNGI
jgi:hypothetical protein